VASAQAIDLDKQNRDPKYVESIVGRSQKIVDKLVSLIKQFSKRFATSLLTVTLSLMTLRKT
jgi:hypothetical protein